MVAASEGVVVVESFESASSVFPERVATMLTLVTTWLVVKEASVPWVIRRVEKTEAIVEINMITAR